MSISKRARFTKTSNYLMILSIIGFVTSLVSLLVSILPCIGVFGAIPGFLAFVISITANLLSKRFARQRLLSFAASIIAGGSLVISIAWGIIVYQSSNNLEGEFTKTDSIVYQRDTIIP